jgi:hypothetical protein
MLYTYREGKLYSYLVLSRAIVLNSEVVELKEPQHISHGKFETSCFASFVLGGGAAFEVAYVASDTVAPPFFCHIGHDHWQTLGILVNFSFCLLNCWWEVAKMHEEDDGPTCR